MVQRYTSVAFSEDMALRSDLVEKARALLRKTLELDGCQDITVTEPRFVPAYTQDDGTEVEDHYEMVAEGTKPSQSEAGTPR